jgi:hypothetical protein
MIAKLNRNRTGTAVALAVAFAVAFSAVGSASTSQTSKQARHGVQSFQITSTTAQEGYLDAAPTGELGVGDSLVFSEDLFKGTKRIGDAGGRCTAVRIDGAASVTDCTETFRLPDGQIDAQGLVTFDPAGDGSREFTWAITGGTGAYRLARGEVSIVEAADGQGSTMDFRITR